MFHLTGSIEDGTPLWEKKFCFLIGSVPWQKVVHTKKFMYSNNVLNWDDSAGKEAFNNAKNRFWAEINGFPCNISLPDPDIYIDEINWDPDIDPELIKNLESVFFDPNDEENKRRFEHGNKKSRNLTAVASKSCNGNSEIIDNPWESNNCVQGRDNLKDEAQDRNRWGNSNNNLNTYQDGNPWERSFTQSDEDVNAEVHGWNQWENKDNNSMNLNCDYNPWELNLNKCNEAVKSNAWGKSRGWDQWVNHVDQFSNWANNASSWKPSEKWGDIGTNSGCWNPQKSWKLNSGDNPSDHYFVQNGEPPKDRGWRTRGGNARSWKQQDKYRSAPKHSEFGRCDWGWGAQNECRQKREGSHLTSYRGYGYQQDYRQTGQCWRSRNANKRVSLG